MNLIAALLSGFIFGAGLAVSGMTDTTKVLGFLDLFGDWDPSLAFVMGGALLLTITGFYAILQKERPLLDSQFYLPDPTKIDKKLIVGATFFGIGWGLYGYCPGPAIASIAYLEPETAIFLVSMVSGMAAARKAQNR